MNNKWENMGDIDFLAYGGCLVKKDDDDIYSVLFVISPSDTGEEYYNVRLCKVNVTDYKTLNDFKDVLYLIGEENRNEEEINNIDNYIWAKEIVECDPESEYFSIENFYDYFDEEQEYDNKFCISEKYLIKLLEYLNVPTEFYI